MVIALAAGLPGCLAAGAAAAGAGTGVYLTSRGAESIVEGSVQDVERRARAVFDAEGIPVSGSQIENSGDKREIKGTKGDLDITVSMERQGAQTTKTEVSARKNIAVWDKDYARELLGKIVFASHEDIGLTVGWLQRYGRSCCVLVPENKEDQPFYMNDDEWKIEGRVLWWFSKGP